MNETRVHWQCYPHIKLAIILSSLFESIVVYIKLTRAHAQSFLNEKTPLSTQICYLNERERIGNSLLFGFNN